MNIVNGDVHLTIVQGGLGKEAEVPSTLESPRLTLPAAERFAKIIESWSSAIHRWEAVAVIEQLEGALGREIAEDEAEVLLANVNSIKSDYVSLQRVFARAATMFPMTHSKTGIMGDFVEFGLDSDQGPGWSDEYEELLKKAKRRSA